MDWIKYRAFLDENLVEAAKDLNLEQSYNFQHDNHPKHTARNKIEWFRLKSKKVWKLTSQSSKLNSSEKRQKLFFLDVSNQS